MVTQRASYGEIVNLSMNQVLMRSHQHQPRRRPAGASRCWSSAWLLGAVALEDFALALLVGLLAGSYSSIFVATPILALLKGKDKRMRSAGRQRAATPPPAARSAASTSSALQPAPDTAGEEQSVPASRPVAAAPATPTAVKPASLTHAPRPRKKRRR